MAQREQVFVGQPQIFGGARLLPSPSQFFLTGEDKLRIVSANSLVGVSLQVQWRTATLTGDVVPSSQTHTPNSDRTIKRQDYELGSGSLLNVTVFAGAGAPVIGQTYVMVQIVRGEGLAAIVLGTILAGYVTTVQALGFPGSPIVSSVEGEPYVRVIAGATPAPGNTTFDQCPTGARWELVTVHNTLTTSATAGSRYPYFATSYAGVTGGLTTWDITIAPSTFTHLTFGQNLNPGENFVSTFANMPIPQRQLLRAGDGFSVAAVGLLGNDQLSAPVFEVREWLEVS